jgi:hypothetical protein
MGLRRYLLVVTAILLAALILAVWFFPSNEDFRIENPFWNGLSDTSASYRIQPLDSPADLPPSPEGTTVIVIPYLSFTPAEMELLSRFVSRGGRLILADDYGHGNQILEYLGLEARFTGQVLLDPVINHKNKQFPCITNLQPDPLTANTDNLVCNHATCLAGVAGGNVLALSSPFSFLDNNDDGTHEDDESTGPLPVISRHELGSGQVILIADPSLFINSMETFKGNANFMQNVAATASVLYIDQSHLPPSELHRSKNLLERAHRLLAIPSATMGLVMAALAVTLLPIWRKKIETADGTQGLHQGKGRRRK